MYVYCVVSFAHNKCYSDCSRKGSQYVGSMYGGLSKNGQCVFHELCPVVFLVVGVVGLWDCVVC